MTRKLSAILGLAFAVLLLVATLTVAAETAKIVNVNPQKGTITLVGADGKNRDMPVSKDMIASLKPGDTVVINKGKVEKKQ